MLTVMMQPLLACALCAPLRSPSSTPNTACTPHTCRRIATAHASAIRQFFSNSDSGPRARHHP
jgi:hypothetical protein